MEEPERAFKDIQKLKAIIAKCKGFNLHKKYAAILEWVENYLFDAEHFYKNKDYYSAFGAANYAYGMVDALLILEGKKDETA